MSQSFSAAKGVVKPVVAEAATCEPRSGPPPKQSLWPKQPKAKGAMVSWHWPRPANSTEVPGFELACVELRAQLRPHNGARKLPQPARSQALPGDSAKRGPLSERQEYPQRI